MKMLHINIGWMNFNGTTETEATSIWECMRRFRYVESHRTSVRLLLSLYYSSHYPQAIKIKKISTLIESDTKQWNIKIEKVSEKIFPYLC